LKVFLKKTKKNYIDRSLGFWCGDCVKAMPKKRPKPIIQRLPMYLYPQDEAMDKWKEGIARSQLAGSHWMNDRDGMKGSFGKSIDLDWIRDILL
jgi:hypothetical protein